MPLKSQLIFVAEDDANLRELVLTRLSLAGYITNWAPDGHTALSLCKQRRPDAMILDISMPGMDGLEVLGRLRKLYPVRPIPTMILTARHSADDVRKAIDLGAVDFMRKPFDDRVLLTRVARLLRRRQDANANALN
jgi:DNA-binding response OmpR family regulator